MAMRLTTPLQPRGRGCIWTLAVAERKGDTLGLAAAAEELDAELCRYEALAAGIQRERLDSEKHLRRAAQALGELQESEARLGQHVQKLVAAIATARDRQEKQAHAVCAQAEEIRRRTEALRALLARWETLGADAGEVNRLVQQLATTARGGTGDNAVGGALREVDERLARLGDDSMELARAAEAEQFADLARQAESLRLQLLSARNKFRLLQGGERPSS